MQSLLLQSNMQHAHTFDASTSKPYKPNDKHIAHLLKTE
jgi:hypothetical protein